ncbi:InlB B-repeat-containing protein [Neobacillus sp. OS1-33]|uniref:fibronectin type III domain-containing protein n=1 Tax=Neobacillus sp. OS1-33 TaxID=3070683 RepID=UPI0027DFF24D|nr:InlB B-repeat-containing protein [Neobacillus sp. OS1-33]WML24581.1 InlB B-repeat-containing protein [Neobacillus sp. OS1-33]
MRKTFSIMILIVLIFEIVLSSNVAYASASDEIQNLSSKSINVNSTTSYLNFYESEANNGTDKANVISNNFTGNSGYYIYGKINNYYYDLDYYKFTVPSDGQFDLKGVWLDDYYGNGWEDDLAIGLEDQNGNTIMYGSLRNLSSGGTYKYINTFLKQGTYYIVAFQSSSYQYLYVDQPYGLIMNFSPSQTQTPYTLSFNSQGGSYVSPVTANSGSTFTQPTAPTRTGYIFGGWYTDAACTNLYDFNTPVTSNVTLYAKWTTNIYRISFNSNGGTSVPSTTVGYNKTFTQPTAPKRTGYTFGGWYTDAACTNLYNFNTPVTSNITLYAKWVVNPATPTAMKVASLTYNTNSISWGVVAGVKGYEVYRSTSSNGTYALVTTTTATSFNNTGLATNTVYYYKVRAYNVVGAVKAYSGFSAVVSAKPIPSTPVNLKVVKATTSSIKITWNGVTGATGYEIYRSMSSKGTYTLVKTVATPSYTNTGLVKGKTYYYKVRAYRMVGKTKVYSGWTTVKYVKL